MTEILRPNLDHALHGLKNFQRETVDYVFRRMYQDQDLTHRFLIADEVGLGKTLVARGLIARAVDYLWDKVDRIDVVYICSNGDIARQNVNRLNILPDSEFALASRITLLPTLICDLKQRKMNFVSFTPGTSFDLQSSMGRADERALLYHLLKTPWHFAGAAPINVLRGTMGLENFRAKVSETGDQEIDADLSCAFAEALQGHPQYQERFEKLCAIFTRRDRIVQPEDAADRSRLVGDLRTLLASTCLRALEPDLIILDEFQRFKDLLVAEDDAGRLAKELFTYSDDQSEVRVVLLSATPYKMYTLQHESAENDHYQDFVQTLEFLLHDEPQEADRLKQLLDDYRQEIYRLGNGGGHRLKVIKDELESRLRRVMVRTERLAATSDRDGMLIEVRGAPSALKPQDLKDYVALSQMAEVIDYHQSMEYWKSAPYLLNFMAEYDLRDRFDEGLQEAEQLPELYRLLKINPNLLLSWNDIKRYTQIDPGNARLRALMADTVDLGAWKLLWIPPALPYYQLQAPFAESALAGFTKRLVFSAWRMVPRVIAALLSYEAERQMLANSGLDPKYTERDKTARPLRFSRADGELTGMPVLGLLYPSMTLATLCDPLAPAEAATPNGLPTAEALLTRFAQHIERQLSALPWKGAAGGREDQRWYWAAPVMLDLASDNKGTTEWFAQDALADTWAGEADNTPGESKSGWNDHVRELAKAALNPQGLNLGPRPKDLTMVLARMGLGGPGNCTLRALRRVTGGQPAVLRDDAARVARAFVTLFNLPDVIALLRSLNPEEPYWQRLLDYTIAGGLQSVLDEYGHVLREIEGLLDAPAEKAAAELSDTMCAALRLRTARLGFDNFKLTGAGNVELENQNLRNRFALRFDKQESDDDQEGARPDQVRQAFNSPFWPFVLATTSVGQEGLDFHPYCHAVVHWNLPTNPVDLEQREGRVHRYKGHAVRKNIARTFGAAALGAGAADPWSAMFAAAATAQPAGDPGLVPYWVYSLADGAKIERHLPMLPLSADWAQIEALRHSLAIYRMVFGQSRQEDMLAYLTQRLPPDIVKRAADILRIDLSPEAKPK